MKKTSWTFVIIGIAIMVFSSWYAEAFSAYYNCKINSIGATITAKINFSDDPYAANSTKELQESLINRYGKEELVFLKTDVFPAVIQKKGQLPFDYSEKDCYTDDDVDNYDKSVVFNEYGDPCLLNDLDEEYNIPDQLWKNGDEGGVDNFLFSQDESFYEEEGDSTNGKIPIDQKYTDEVRKSYTGISSYYVDENGEIQAEYTRDVNRLVNPFQIKHDYPLYVGKYFDSVSKSDEYINDVKSVIETYGSIDNYNHQKQSNDDNIIKIGFFVLIIGGLIILVIVIIILIEMGVIKTSKFKSTKFDEIKKGDKI